MAKKKSDIDPLERRRMRTAAKRATAANVKEVTVMARRQKGGKAAHAEVLQRAKVLDRRHRIWRLMVSGNGENPFKSYRQIAKMFGVSHVTVMKDILAVANERNAETLQNKELWRALTMARTEALVEANLPYALGLKGQVPQPAHARVIFDSMERQARVIGIEPREDGSYSSEQVARLMKFQAQLFIELTTDPLVRQRYLEEVRRKIGSDLASTLKDVTPQKEGTND